MFSSGPCYNKLKTNLRLCINRLKLLEKKKTELALKSRKEIADYISAGKVERAKIRVEHIIREDYLVEAMEILEMYCDLLLARFGLIQQMKALDEGLAEAISSVIWATPRLQADVAELKIVSEQLAIKYGKPYALACQENAIGSVSVKLMHKLGVQAPPKLTVEKYMIEIAKYYNVEYQPDPQVLREDEAYAADALIDLAPAPPAPSKADFGHDDDDAAGGGAGMPTSAFQYPTPMPPQLHHPQHPPTHPFYVAAAFGHPAATHVGGAMGYPPPHMSSTYPHEKNGGFDDGPPPYFPPDMDSKEPVVKSADRAVGHLDLPELPGVPEDTPVRETGPDSKPDGDPGDDIDFDDLTKRFEALKKKK